MEDYLVYSKLLEAHNEKIQNSLNERMEEIDTLKKKQEAIQKQYDGLYDDIAKFLQSSRIHVIEHPPFRRRKAYVESIWTNSWYHDGQHNNTGYLHLRPIAHQIWLDFLEGSVKGMKNAVKCDIGGKITYRYVTTKVKFNKIQQEGNIS